MDLELSDEQRLIVETVRDFVRREIVPREADLDPDSDELPRDQHELLVAKVKDMGLYCPDVPGELGGPGIDTLTFTLMCMEMSQHRAGLYAPCYGVFGGSGLAQLLEASEDQKQRYLYPLLEGRKRSFFGLTEPAGGSDPAGAIQTTAHRDGDAWVLNGTKHFISGADRADFGITFARTDKAKGRDGITCFIVDTDAPGFHVRRIIHTLRSAHYATEIQFDDLRVPDENVLGEVGKGFGIARDRVARRRIPYAAGCIGVAILAQQMAIQYAQARSTFGAPLATRQAVQWMIVENEIDIHQARWVTLDAAWKADRSDRFYTAAAMAKIVATEAAGRVVDRSMQIHGGMGVAKELPLERWYRELRIKRIGEGPNEVQRMIIARDLLRRSGR
jgi:alkylation response protein AidB-like acyl-CoA dehydrogenase